MLIKITTANYIPTLVNLSFDSLDLNFCGMLCFKYQLIKSRPSNEPVLKVLSTLL